MTSCPVCSAPQKPQPCFRVSPSPAGSWSLISSTVGPSPSQCAHRCFLINILPEISGALDAVRGVRVVGVDTETKPQFQAGRPQNRISLVRSSPLVDIFSNAFRMFVFLIQRSPVTGASCNSHNGPPVCKSLLFPPSRQPSRCLSRPAAAQQVRLGGTHITCRSFG